MENTINLTIEFQMTNKRDIFYMLPMENNMISTKYNYNIVNGQVVMNTLNFTELHQVLVDVNAKMQLDYYSYNKETKQIVDSWDNTRTLANNFTVNSEHYNIECNIQISNTCDEIYVLNMTLNKK